MDRRMVNDFLNYFSQSADTGTLVPLDYIEGTGTQYIDTGLKVYHNLDIEASIQFTSMTIAGGSPINGGYTSANGLTYRADFAGIVDNMFWVGCSTEKVTTNVPADLERHTFHINTATGEWSIDDVSGAVTPATFVNNSIPLLIFDRGKWTLSSDKCREKVYWVKIKVDGVLARDFVPMLRLEDNKPGLYDKVLKRFYVNKGTGEEFDYYPKLPSRYVRLEWLATNNGAQIDTQVQGANNNLKFVSNLKWTGYTQYKSFYTAYNSEAANATRIIMSSGDNGSVLAYLNTKASGGSNQVSMPKGVWHDVVHTRASVIVDGVTTVCTNTTQGTALNATVKMYGGSNTSSTVYFSRFRIYDNDVLIRDYLPCYDFLTETYGMYDACESVCPITNSPFYTNVNSSGSFIAPPLVSSKYTLVNYIESITTSASQVPYIILPINTNEISKIMVDYCPTVTSWSSDHYFGSNYGFAVALRSSGKWFNANTGLPYEPNKRIVLSLTLSGTTKTYYVDDGVAQETTHNTSTYQGNRFYVFALSNNTNPETMYSGPCLKGKCYRIAYWDTTGILKGVFVPAVRNADGVIGLLDLYGSICPLTGTSFYISERGNLNLTFG